MQKLLLMILLWALALPLLSAQSFFRFRTDFSIKEKLSGEAKGQLVTGTLFYDKNSGNINHQVTFPVRSNWLVQDTVMFEIVNDSLRSTQTIPPYSQYSIYRLILDQQLSDFGLGKAGYTLADHQQPDSTTVLATWIPPAKLSKQLGQVVVSSTRKLVDGIAFYDAKQALIAKFYLKDYVNVDDLQIPSKYIQIIYPGEGKPEYLRIIQFSHIVIDENGSDENYNLKLPAVGHRR